MNEFEKVMKNWRRMCNYYDATYGDNCCNKCPIDFHYCNAIFEMPENTNYEEIVNIVNTWANEHPPIHYITWREYFYINGFDLNCEIPEQIGKKLNLRPLDNNKVINYE